MTRLKFDVEGVDPGGDFAVPKPGAYQCKIDVIEPKESSAGNEMLEVQYVITEKGEFNNSRLWDYIVLTENQKWKYRRFLEAVGAVTGQKEKGEIDIDKLIGKRVLVKVTNEDSEEYGKRARVGSVSKLKSADVEDDADEDGEDEDEGEDLTYEDVQAMTKKELKELIDELVEEEEIDRIRVTKQTKLNTLRDKVCEALELEEEDEDEPEDEDEDEIEDEDEVEDEDAEDEEELTADDIRGMKKTELKELIDEEGLGLRVTKQTKLAALRDRVVEKAVEEGLIVDPDEEDEDEDDDVEEVEDYAELGVADLRNECKERGLNSKGSKSALVKRLEKDDEETGAL